jgi:flagellar protein FliO/FliZ
MVARASLRCVLPIVAALGASPARAADAAAPDIGVGGLAQAILGLALVLALIWGAAWVMRRLQPHGASGAGTLKIVATQAVGQRERVVVLEVAEQWLVVGVAPGSVSALARLPKGTVAPITAPANPFAHLLARARGQTPQA